MAPHGHLLVSRCRFISNLFDCILWTGQYSWLQKHSWFYSNNLLSADVYLIWHIFTGKNKQKVAQAYADLDACLDLIRCLVHLSFFLHIESLLNRSLSTSMLDFCHFNMQIFQFNIQIRAFPHQKQTATPAIDCSAANSTLQKKKFCWHGSTFPIFLSPKEKGIRLAMDKHKTPKYPV